MARRIRVQVDKRWYVVQVDDVRANPVRVLVDGEPVEIEVEGLPYRGTEVNQELLSPPETATKQSFQVKSPMPGVIVSVTVRMGQEVSRGDQVCVLEAIKLQQSINAPAPGVVRTIHVEPGQSVASGQNLMELW